MVVGDTKNLRMNMPLPLDQKHRWYTFDPAMDEREALSACY
jgi:hypothetical protein